MGTMITAARKPESAQPPRGHVFVLGAGFSVEQGYPLARTMKEDVICFLESKQIPWQGFMKRNGPEYQEGQFYAGLQIVEENGELQFEELLLTLSERIREVEGGPYYATDFMLRLGARLRLWEIKNSTDVVNAAYTNFATWLRVNWQHHGIISFNWDLQAELALCQAGVPWHYSQSAQGRLPVIKPHGSINWNRYRQENLTACYPHWQAVDGTKLSFNAKQPLSDPKLDENVPNLNYMLFPGDNDRPESQHDMELLWREAACLIRKAEEIVFIGYSFPNYDCYSQEFFRDEVRGKKVVVINPNTDDLKKFRRVLNNNYAEIVLRKETFGDSPYAQAVTGE